MATIKDVAREANVSVATVSRVLNNNYPVHKDTRDTVMKAVEKLHYQRNAVARGLKKKETFLIGLVAPDISNPYYMEIARGIESIVSQEGYSLIFCSTDEEQEKEEQMLTMLHGRQVDAVILASRSVNGEVINYFIKDGMTIVLIDTKISGVVTDSVYENDYDAVVEAIEYAIDMGHSKIGIINGNMSVSTGKSRFKAYQDILAKYDIPVRDDYMVEGKFSRHVAYRNAKTMLEIMKDDLPTLIFSANNYMTEGLIIAMKEIGLTIGQDISIISFGDVSVPGLLDVKLTILEQNSSQIGRNAGKLLLERLNNTVPSNSFREVELQLNFKQRDSVKKI